MKFIIAAVILMMSSPALSETAKLSKYENFYFSATPSVETLKEFKANGGVAVVDLREFDEKEKDCGEVITVTKLEMKYMAAMMPKAAPLSQDTVRQVEEAVKAANGKPILLHCTTGQRAAAWLAVHLAKTKGMKAEEAIATAQSVGLTSEHMQDAVKDYLKK